MVVMGFGQLIFCVFRNAWPHGESQADPRVVIGQPTQCMPPHSPFAFLFFVHLVYIIIIIVINSNYLSIRFLFTCLISCIFIILSLLISFILSLKKSQKRKVEKQGKKSCWLK